MSATFVVLGLAAFVTLVIWAVLALIATALRRWAFRRFCDEVARGVSEDLSLADALVLGVLATPLLLLDERSECVRALRAGRYGSNTHAVLNFPKHLRAKLETSVPSGFILAPIAGAWLVDWLARQRVARSTLHRVSARFLTMYFANRTAERRDAIASAVASLDMLSFEQRRTAMIAAYKRDVSGREGVAIPAYLGYLLGLTAGSDQSKWSVEIDDGSGTTTTVPHSALLVHQFWEWSKRVGERRNV